jgi:hypothetical protein
MVPFVLAVLVCLFRIIHPITTTHDGVLLHGFQYSGFAWKRSS